MDTKCWLTTDGEKSVRSFVCMRRALEFLKKASFNN